MIKYKINEYIKKLNEKNLIEKVEEIDLEKIVNHISYDSKQVKKDTLFICKGANFKFEYLESAIKSGAIMYVATEKKDVSIPGIIVNDIQKAQAIIASVFYSYPQNKLNIVGITGTKGKSTTTMFLEQIFAVQARETKNNRPAIISTIKNWYGENTEISHMTTPEPIVLLNYFEKAVEHKIETAIMEVSSQALKYDRVYDILFEICVFLNISEDHISPIEHSSYEDYFYSKLKIFERSNVAVINRDSDDIKRICEAAKKSKEIITFSTKDSTADVYAYDIEKDQNNCIKFKVRTKKMDTEFKLAMPGFFNVENALAAIAVAEKLGIDKKYIIEGLKTAKVNGRMEMFKSKDDSIVSIVDFAHNKLSFEKLFESVKNEYPNRTITAIFGCPGGKAFSRRRDLGIVAGKNADRIFLVPDDPAYEDPKAISQEIEKYVREFNENVEYLPTRAEAIKKAVETASAHELLLVLGKGDEDTIKIGSKNVPYVSDTENVKALLQEKDKISIKK